MSIIDNLDLVSNDKQSMPCLDGDTKTPFPLLDLPDTLLHQVLLKLPPSELYGILTTCPPLKLHAETALYSQLIVDTRDRLDRLMKCRPNPEAIAADVKHLEVVGSLTSPAKEYVERLEEYAPHLTSKKVVHREVNNSSIPFVTTSRHSHMVRELQVGCYSRERVSDNDRLISFSELASYPNLIRLHWIPVDARVGSVQHVYKQVHKYCPDLEVLELPWSDRIDDTPWDALPTFRRLRRLTWHFNHMSKVNLTQFVRCLRTFQSRNIPTCVGSGCDREVSVWLHDLYRRLQGTNPDLLRWVLQNNHKHLIKSYKLPPAEKELLFRAIEDVEYSPETSDKGLKLDADLAPGSLPEVLLSGKLRYVRLIVNKTNVDRNHIPSILRANPYLQSLVVVKHLDHHGRSYDGNCTYAKVPLLPGQDVVRQLGSQFTIPGVELMFRVRREQELNNPTKKPRLREWRRLNGGKSVAAEHLPDLDMRGITREAWNESLLARLDAWEGEVKGWFDLSPRLKTIGVILNTDRDKFGNLEEYYCACDSLHTTA
jgi:hypothetical protein